MNRMIDIVIPHNNEEEFISIAEKLGYSGLLFLYSPNDYLDKHQKLKIQNTKIKIHTGIVVDNQEIHKVKSGLKNEKAFIVVKSSTNDKEAIEKLKPDVIFSFEGSIKKDFIHQRASGLNHILCKAAKDKGVMIGFSLSSILNVEDKHRILGRMMQNIQLCRKYKVKMIIASFAQGPFGMRSPHDLIGLFKVLGCENPSFLGNV